LPILVSTRPKHRSRSSTIRAVVIYSPTRPCPSNTTPPVRSCCGNESLPSALPEPTGGRPLGTAAGVSIREPQMVHDNGLAQSWGSRCRQRIRPRVSRGRSPYEEAAGYSSCQARVALNTIEVLDEVPALYQAGPSHAFIA
jgi:hypothetical protein